MPPSMPRRLGFVIPITSSTACASGESSWTFRPAPVVDKATFCIMKRNFWILFHSHEIHRSVLFDSVEVFKSQVTSCFPHLPQSIKILKKILDDFTVLLCAIKMLQTHLFLCLPQPTACTRHGFAA